LEAEISELFGVIVGERAAVFSAERKKSGVMLSLPKYAFLSITLRLNYGYIIAFLSWFSKHKH
jgi:hypothetical protein